MKENNNGTKRLTLQVPTAVWERMTNLRDATEAASIAEVIRRSLAVYEYAVECQESGERLVIEGEDGSRKEIIVA